MPFKLGGRGALLAHSKKPRPSRSDSLFGLHLPRNVSPPLTVVPMTYSSAPS